MPWQAGAQQSSHAVIQNNRAADFLKRALEKQKPKEEKSVFDNVLDFFFKKEAEPSKEVLDAQKAPPEPASQEHNDEGTQGQFQQGLSKEEKEKSEIDSEAVHQAYLSSLDATLEAGESPEVRLNLALAFELNGDLDNAIKSYKMAIDLSKTNPATLFLGHYNLARALGLKEKVEEALMSYQAALDIYPESKEVKVNIELLLQQKQGGGGGGKDNKDDDKEGQDQEPKPDSPIKENPKNSEYKSQNLSKKDVEKILEELKNQEQQIRAKEYGKGVKEKPRDKDW